MARKLRLEYPGALYHIINRGNYRRWILAHQKGSTRCLLLEHVPSSKTPG